MPTKETVTVLYSCVGGFMCDVLFIFLFFLSIPSSLDASERLFSVIVSFVSLGLHFCIPAKKGA